jgi:hypothetical protein
VARTQLFRDLKKAQNNPHESFKEVAHAEADGTPVMPVQKSF